MPFMRTAADLASNAENLGHIRRAHQGVCWTLGIPVLPRNDDPLDVQMARRAALRAVIESANGGPYGCRFLGRLRYKACVRFSREAFASPPPDQSVIASPSSLHAASVSLKARPLRLPVCATARPPGLHGRRRPILPRSRRLFFEPHAASKSLRSDPDCRMRI
jgi:hypothetical protein